MLIRSGPRPVGSCVPRGDLRDGDGSHRDGDGDRRDEDEARRDENEVSDLDEDGSHRDGDGSHRDGDEDHRDEDETRRDGDEVRGPRKQCRRVGRGVAAHRSHPLNYKHAHPCQPQTPTNTHTPKNPFFYQVFYFYYCA